MEIDRSRLPNDLDQCHRMLAGLFAELDLQDHKLRRLQHIINNLMRRLYGQKSERVDPNQLFLFAIDLLAKDESAKAPEKPPTSPPRGKRPGHGRKPLPENLERKRVVFDLPEDKKFCPECHLGLNHLGEDVTERLEYVPASFLVIEEATQKYGCPKGCGVVAAEKPAAPIEKGLPGPGLLAHVVVSKYADHLPLYRQAEIFKRHGVDLARSTMSGWMAKSAEMSVPLYDLMKEQVLASKAVQTDDTPVSVLDPELTRTRTGRIWTYVGDKDHPFTVYDYTPDRCRAGPAAFLEGYEGYLQADAYTGYDELFKAPTLSEVACWAHTRRKFYEAQGSDPARSMIMLAYIRLLYDVEREARGLRGAERLALRQAKSVTILNDIEAFLKLEQTEVLPKSPVGQAIAYTLSNWQALIRYCEDGDLEIDNNGAERNLRGLAVGRKNWLFFGSDAGGRTAAVLASLIASCKRLKVEPFAYLNDVFARINTHPKNQLEDLLPNKWQQARTPVSV